MTFAPHSVEGSSADLVLRGAEIGPRALRAVERTIEASGKIAFSQLFANRDNERQRSKASPSDLRRPDPVH